MYIIDLKIEFLLKAISLDRVDLSHADILGAKLTSNEAIFIYYSHTLYISGL